jgi:hypothetical protein
MKKPFRSGSMPDVTSQKRCVRKSSCYTSGANSVGCSPPTSAAKAVRQTERRTCIENHDETNFAIGSS